jgi:acid phosphatase
LKVKYIKFTWVISLIILLSGCGPEVPINLTVAKYRVENYYESGLYQEDLSEIVGCALKHFEKVPVTGNETVIFDVDDTVLSNYADSKSISFGYVPKMSHEWVLQADAPAIIETKNLYDYLVKKGFKIVFITGRKYNEHEPTVKNLKAQGFMTFDKLIVRQKHEIGMTAEKYKSGRRKQLTEEGYKIVGCIGDQESDLRGGYSGHQVKVPNYMYMIP